MAEPRTDLRSRFVAAVRRPRRAGTVMLAIAAACLAGCSGYRVVLEPVPDPETFDVVTIDETTPAGRDRVAFIAVDGFMVDAPRGGLLSRGENPVARLASELDKARDDDRVKAVVLRINTRGGTVTASDMMYGEITRFREETGKPVVALLGGVAASGGYFLACGCDLIVAHPTTVTGSIGVITQTVQFGEALERLGIHADAVVSGPNKAIASPFGTPNAEHRARIQQVVDELYARFIEVVEAGRPSIDRGAFDMITDGRVFTGRRAHALGLVDEVADADRAFALARDLAGIERSTLVRYVRPGRRAAGTYAGGSMMEGMGAPNAGDGSAGDGGVDISLIRIDGLDWGLLPRTNFLYTWAPGTG